MGTNYIAPIWRMPINANKDKLSNYSIDFAGGTEYINCGTDSTIQFQSTFSISCWVKTSNTSQNKFIIHRGVTYSETFQDYRLLITSTGNAQLRVNNNSYTVTSTETNLDDGNWHHIVAICDLENTDGYIYVDNGTPATNTSFPSSLNLNTGYSTYISSPGGTFDMIGEMSQICIFDYALSTNQIGYLYNLNNPMAISGAEPIAYWPLGDNSNPIATAGYPNISVGADSVFNIPTKPGQKYIETNINNLSDIDVTDKITVSTWVNFDDVTVNAYNPVVQKGTLFNSTNMSFTITRMRRGNASMEGQVYASIKNTSGTAVSAYSDANAVSSGEWANVVMRYDGAHVKIYVNGKLHESAAQTGNILDSTPAEPFTIGSNYYYNAGFGNNLVGKISNVQIWNTDLTDGGVSDGSMATGQIAELYNNGQPLMTGTQPQAANLRAWYKLNQSANWEADTVGDWQIPDAVSSYPQSFDFSGTNQNINLGNDASLYPGTSDMSYSFWFKSNSLSGYKTIFGQGATDLNALNQGDKGVFITTLGDELRIFVCSNTGGFGNDSNSAFDTSNANFVAGKFYHIAFTLNRDGNAVIYINGVPNTTQAVKSSSASVDIVSNDNTIIGGVAYDFDGQISNFQIFNTVLPATGTDSVETLYNNGVPLTTAIATANLKAWYKLDNNELFDGTNWSVENQKYPANWESALDFDGSSNVNTSENTGTNNVTFSAWIKTTETFAYTLSRTAFGGRNNVAGSNYTLGRLGAHFASANDMKVRLFNSYGSTKLNDGKWHHIVYTHDYTSKETKAYVDGNTTPEATVTFPGYSGSFQIAIGWNGFDTGFKFTGNVSNCLYYNKVLTGSEINTLYNNGSPELLPSFSPAGWWKCDNITTGIQDSVGSNDGTNNGATKVNTFVSTEAATSSGMTEQNLVNNNVSALNGESVSMNTTNLVQSNLTRKKPFSNYSVHFDNLDYFEDSGGGFLNGATTFTISAWARFDTLGSNPVINAWGTDRQYLLRHVNNSSDGFQFYVGGNFNTGSPATFILAETGVSIPVAVDTWYNIVGTFDGTTANIYVNGVLGGSGSTTSGTLNSTASPNQIGRFSSTYMDGYISNAAYWVDVVLNQDDILNIYNNGVSQDLNNFRIKPTNWVPLDQSHTYYNGSVIVARDAIGGGELDGQNLIQENIAGKAPGSEANGTGTNLTIADLKSNMSNSDKNAYSINMGDYADGITNPANSGRSTNVP